MKKNHLIWTREGYRVLNEDLPLGTDFPPPEGGDDLPIVTPGPDGLLPTPEPTPSPEPTPTPEPTVTFTFADANALHAGYTKEARLDGVMRVKAADQGEGDYPGSDFSNDVTHLLVRGLIEIKNVDRWADAIEGGVRREFRILITGGTLTIDGDTMSIQGAKDKPILLDLEPSEELSDRIVVEYEGKVVFAQAATPVPTPAPTAFVAAQETREATQAPYIEYPVVKKESSPIPWIVMGVALVLCAATSLLFLMSLRRRKRGSKSAHIQYAALQNVGRRSGQQDSFDVVELEDGLIATVADGMGGLSDGDKVSRRIVQVVRQKWGSLRVDQLLRKLPQMVMKINDEVNQMLGQDGLCKSGSTLVMALVQPDRIEWISVGDSRIYLYRGRSLLQLNREHDFETDLELYAVNHEIDFEEAYTHPKKRSVSSYMGMGRLKAVDTMRQAIAAEPGDRLLLMSDGVFNALSSEEMADILTRYANVHEAAAAMETAVLAHANPHQDNFTAVIIGFEA